MVDLDGQIRNEAELITKYRQMAYHPEVRAAINHIINEAITVADESEIVELNAEELKDELPPELLSAFNAEFEEVLRLLEFNVNSYEVFKKWYIDGRITYHVIIDKEVPQAGIRELRYIDPRKIKKVKEIERRSARNDVNPTLVQRVKAEYYIFNETGFNAKAPSPMPGTSTNVGLKIHKDSVVMVNSGILDEPGTTVLSYLHEAIRPLNMLRTMEDSAVIYRLVRAPERRVWYIDVGNLPKYKAEQVLYDMMSRHRNKLVYDPSSGQVKDQRRHQTMLEDIWLTRREGNKGTQVETLPGSQNLGQMEEVQYFLKKLYKSLNVPIGRLEPELMYSLGRPSEITREEVDFTKFIDRIRTRFCELFLDLLEKQLILKGYVSPEEWDQIRPRLRFKWAQDNYFSELKEQEVMLQRMNVLQLVMPAVGRYVSNEWVRVNVLQQTDEEMKEIDQQIIGEMQNPIYMVPISPDGVPMDLGPGMSPGPMPPPAKKK